MTIMIQLKDHLKSCNQVKNANTANYKIFSSNLEKYEELNLYEYIKSTRKMVFSTDENEQLRQQMGSFVEGVKNPFQEMYNWIKGEIYDIQALQEAVNKREELDKTRSKLLSQKAKNQNDLANVTAGKTTMRTILKKDAGAISQSIEMHDREIEWLEELVNIVTIYLGERVLPRFKEDRASNYRRMMSQLSMLEINNSHQSATFFS